MIFDRIRELNKLRQQAKEMERQLQQIHVELEERGVRVVIRGDQVIEDLSMDGVERGEVKDILNKAIKEVQKKVAAKMYGSMKDLGIPGLS